MSGDLKGNVASSRQGRLAEQWMSVPPLTGQHVKFQGLDVVHCGHPQPGDIGGRWGGQQGAHLGGAQGFGISP